MQLNQKLQPTLLLIFLLVSAQTYSQQPHQIADTTKAWHTLSYGAYPWNVMSCFGTRIHKLGGEVEFNGDTYHYVYESHDSLQQEWAYAGYLREDTIEKKVYYAVYFDDGIGLLYDFNLVVGDSVVIDNYYFGVENIVLVCDSIDMVMIDNRLRKRLFLYAVESPGWSDTWIEGIGSTFGLLNSGFNGAAMAGGTHVLLCCSGEGNLIYTDSIFYPAFGSCYIQEFYPRISSAYFDTAYLDTYYEFQVQISDANNVNSFELIGELIPEGFQFDAATGLITSLPETTGSFLCAITIQNNDLGFLTDMLLSEIIVTHPTAVNKLIEKKEFHLFPNPADGHFNVLWEKGQFAHLTLEVYNAKGLIVDRFTVAEPMFTIDCSNYESGTYFLKILGTHNEVIHTEVFIKK